jgi:hypothetical protein
LFPALDLIGVGVGMTVLGLGLGNDEAGVTAAGAGTSAIFTSAAVYGFATIGTCNSRATAE